jgi:hypothetical protein
MPAAPDSSNEPRWEHGRVSTGQARNRQLRFRHNSAITVAALLAVIAGVSLAKWAVYLLPLLLVPLAVAVWGWRSGTDVDATGITVRAAVGRRHVPWTEVAGFAGDDRGRVTARLTSGRALRLVAVPASALPRVVAASGQELLRSDPR